MRRTRRHEGFESATGSGTILMSIPCTNQTPDVQIFLMQLRGMPWPTCSLVGGHLHYRFHERDGRIRTRKVRILLKLIYFDVGCLNFTHLVRLSSSQGSGMSRRRSAAADGYVPILGSVRPLTLVRSVAGKKHLPTLGYADAPSELESSRRPIKVSSCSLCSCDLV